MSKQHLKGNFNGCGTFKMQMKGMDIIMDKIISGLCRQPRFWKSSAVISITFLTLMLSHIGKWGAAGVICAFFLACILVFKADLLKRILEPLNLPYAVVSLLLSCCADYTFVKAFYGRFFIYLERIKPLLNSFGLPAALLYKSAVICIGVLAFPAVFMFLYAFINKFAVVCREWISHIDRIEKTYLICGSFLLFTAVFIIFNLTNVFYAPMSNGSVINWDVVYTSDTGNQMQSNVYLNICAGENDIRQPLFGVFAMPFAAAAFGIASCLFFVPNIFLVLMNIIQIVLLLCNIIMIARILKLTDVSKAFFLCVSTITYPTLLFSLNMEQYVFAVFWVILLIYLYMSNNGCRDYCYIAATGSMLTSGVLFPLITDKSNFVCRIKEVLKTGLKLLIMIILFGQFSALTSAVSQIAFLMRFNGASVSLCDRVLQFLNFTASCFIKPQTIIDTLSSNHISYQLMPVETVNVIGIAVISIAVLGYIANYKNRFAQISAFWVLFSFVLLCAVGWGTAENGLILYSLYFSWAYLSLIFMLIEKLLSKHNKLKYLIYITAIILLAAVNIPGIYDVIKFGIEYYPVR